MTANVFPQAPTRPINLDSIDSKTNAMALALAEEQRELLMRLVDDVYSSQVSGCNR